MAEENRLSTLTRLIRSASSGDRNALDDVVTILHDELRSRAHRGRRQWRGDQTLSTTALVNEAYLRMAGQDEAQWENRAHFLAVASRAMRQILIDYSRQRSAQKRGGLLDRVTLDRVSELLHGLQESPTERAEMLVDLDDCLNRLEEENPRYCRIVECRFFGGMTIEETAQALEISTATVKRGWTTARAWLHRELNRG